MKVVASLVVFSILGCMATFGQAVSVSQIRGTVQDSSGLPIAGAEVKMTQAATGAVRVTATGADGNYVFLELPIGPYQLEASKTGFSKYVQTGIVLQVNSNPTVDVTLNVGAVTEQIRVEANASMVETQSNGVGQVIDQQRVVDIPLNGRQPTDLIFLTPGVTNGRTFRASYPSSVSVSIAGGQAGSVGYSLDGGNHNDGLSNQNLPLPFPDALQEFKVETSALPAQYGYYASGAVNAVTKSGSNQVHGDLFEFVRNYEFNARNSFQPTRDNLKRNQFGGTVGGPIKKDKLFFFLGYQDSIVRSNPTAPVAFVPTAAMLNGDFSACPSLGPKVIPAGATLSPIARNIAALLPTSADPCGRVTYASVQSYTENQGVARLDYQVNSKHSIFGRYFITRYEQPPGANIANLLIASQIGFSNQVQNMTIGDTYLISPSMVNAFRITGSRSTNTTVTNDYTTLAALGVQGIYQQPINGLLPHFVSGIGVVGAFTVGSTPASQPYNTINLSDDVNVLRGAHQLSFGTNLMKVRAFAINYLNTNGNFSFNGTGGTGSAMGDFVYGRPASYTQNAPFWSTQRQTIFGVYAQDVWKLNRKLTLNIGVRWDPFFGHTDPRGYVSRFSLDAFNANYRSTIYPNAPVGMLFPGDPGGPTDNKFTSDRLGQFSPRIGIAWDPVGDGKMSIRAGYGMFYNFPSMSFDQFGITVPFGAALSVGNPVFSSPWTTFPGGNPYPGNFGSKSALFPPNALQISYPVETKTPYVQQFNFTVQRQFGSNWLIQASYLGNLSRHLWLNQEINPALFVPGTCQPGQYGRTTVGPCSDNSTTLYRRVLSQLNPTPLPASNAPFNAQPYYGSVTILYPYGTGSYNSLALTASHRFAKNFTSTTNFTLAHCISDLYAPALGYGPFTSSNPSNPRGDRGNCPGADVRQTFNESLVFNSPKFSSRPVQLLAGDWKVGVAVKADSGQFLTVNTGADTALNGVQPIPPIPQRPNQVLADVYLPNKGQAGWLNPKAFAAPAQGSYGNLGIANIQGPGALNIDMSLSRMITIREKQQLELRAEAFNLPNIVNLYNPVLSPITAPNFGVPTAPTTNPSPRNDPRIMQFALKYIF